MTPTQLLNISNPVQLLDVRLSDEYEACHLVGANNNCIHEVTFIGKLAETASDKSLTTVVYGMNLTGNEAAVAFSKLLRAGYSNVHVLEGGLEARFPRTYQLSKVSLSFQPLRSAMGSMLLLLPNRKFVGPDAIF